MEKEVEIIEETEQRYPHEALQDIEDKRSDFLGIYRKHNSLKVLVAVICIALILVAFILIPSIHMKNEVLQKGLTIGIAILGLGGTLGYSIFTRRLMDKKMRNYFNSYYENVAKYVFDKKGYSKAEVQFPGKINLEQFNDCRLYKDVIEVGSRGLTEFEFNKLPMAVVDCAGNVKTEKRMAPVFVGKCLFAAANYKEDDPIVVYLKGNERSLPPTNLEGMKMVEEEVKYVIYSNSKNWKKTITPDVIKLITAIKTNNNLVDLAISIYGGRVFVMMGYDDPIMILPLQNLFDSKPIEMYKDDMYKVCKVVEALNK